MYDAMEARGYDGTVKVLRLKQQVKRKEIFLLAVFEILLMICAAAERMML